MAVAINKTYGRIERIIQAARRKVLPLCFGLPDDARVIGLCCVVADLNSSQAASAAGTNRIHAGSMGGQLATRAGNVPFCFARAIFSGTAQRETYQLNRGESAGSRATA